GHRLCDVVARGFADRWIASFAMQLSKARGAPGRSTRGVKHEDGTEIEIDPPRPATACTGQIDRAAGWRVSPSSTLACGPITAATTRSTPAAPRACGRPCGARRVELANVAVPRGECPTVEPDDEID